MKMLGLIFIWGFILYLNIIDYLSYKLQKRNIKYLLEKGKKAKAKIIDYISFRTYSGDELKFNCYPLLEIYDGEKKILQIYVRNMGIQLSNIVKKDFLVGDIVDVYYIESHENIIQLNWEKNIFLNKEYNKLSILRKADESKNKKINFFVASNRDQKLSSEVSDNIPDLPDTHIKENDIYIIGSSEEKTTIKLWLKWNIYFIIVAIIFTIVILLFY